MREQLSQLSLLQLRDIAKSKGIRNVTSIRKSALVEQIAQILEAEDAQNDMKPAPDNAEETAASSGETSLPSSEETSAENDSQESKSETPAAKESGQTPETAPVSRSQGHPRERQSARTRGNSYAGSRSPRNYDRTSEAAHTENRKNADTSDTAPLSRGKYRTASRSESKSDAFNPADYAELDSGENAHGILEIMADGFGFIRSENFLPGDNDVYVSPAQIRRFNMKTGDFITGSKRIRTQDEKFQALLYISQINGRPPHEAETRTAFEDLTPVFPNSRLHLETFNGPQSMRIMDLISPIGKGQRGMIVSPPKAGKTTLLKQVAKAVTTNHPDIHLIILLIDERPEEVTDIKEFIEGSNVEVIYSTFDEQPEHHKRVTEMVLERAKRLVEHKRDVMILLDSITRLARAYNLLVTPSGRTLSGGLDPASLYLPKRFFGAARNMREGGSLTILSTALVETGSRMDDVIFEEFKGTGNMELVLDRRLSEKRIFPAIELLRSGTRRDDLLLNPAEQEATAIMRRATTGLKPEEAAERILELFAHTKTNREFVDVVRRQKFI